MTDRTRAKALPLPFLQVMAVLSAAAIGTAQETPGAAADIRLIAAMD